MNGAVGVGAVASWSHGFFRPRETFDAAGVKGLVTDAARGLCDWRGADVTADGLADEGADGFFGDEMGGIFARDGADDGLFVDRADGCAFGDTAIGEI